MPTYRFGRAAQLLGVSDDTVRRWADSGRLQATTDDQGHRVVTGDVLAQFALAQAAEGVAQQAARRGRRVSARNAFPGLVTRITLGAVAAQVEVQAGPHRVVSLLTREAVEELGLAIGDEVVASVKATSVMVERP
ncbi:MAG: TOBE domain-containing protein [Actinomycetes bacterium]